MKLIVTIPAYNESASIAEVIKSIPRSIPGIASLQVLVWDDGSTDNTTAIAKKAGADYVFTNKRNLGLARTFEKATNKALALGADVIVNTDADDQYDQSEIALLVKPILKQQADVVTGNRRVETLSHMPFSKKYGNMLGSLVIRLLTGLKVQDASSGFRAYTAEALEILKIYSRRTYTHETLIQAMFNGLTIVEVPVTFKAREKNSGSSRLIPNVSSHILISGVTIIRTILIYRAFEVFVSVGLMEILLSFIIGGRYVWLLWSEDSSGHVQSLILSSMLFTLGLFTIMTGILADLIVITRKKNNQRKYDK